MAIWSSNKLNRHQPRERLVRLAMTSVGCVAAGYVVLGLTGWLAPPPRTAVQAAQPPASVDAQTIRYPSAGGAMIEAYIARPEGASRNPAVIVVHDDLGANRTFRELAHQFGEAGFVALVPHLPSRSGTPAADPSEGGPPQRTPVAGLSWIQTVDDLIAAFTFLQQDSGVDAARISAVGVGWGEFRVWKLAEQAPTLHRVVVYYGLTPPDDDRLRAVRVAVLGHYAQQDYLATARVLKTKQLLGERFTYYVYPTVPGFLGGGTGRLQQPTGGYVTSLAGSTPQAVAAAAKQSWARTLDFLRQG
jgi:dienelactone hydrolase